VSERKDDLPVKINCGTLFPRVSILPSTLLAVSLALVGNAENASAAQPHSANANPAQQNVAPGKQDSPPAAASPEYVIGPEDVLAVTVWKEPDISKTLPVRPDGKISLPLVGELQASGLTASKLQDVIAQKLKEYIENPQVNVIVEEVKSRSFNIVGKVLKPGSFDLAKPTAVLDAIALAGGFQDFAKVSKIYVLRRMPDGSQRMLPFNYKLVIKGKRLDENIELQSGDTVVVP
jgi:polysaccharide biosynthesis/export protein